jgi:hypothetical protein
VQQIVALVVDGGTNAVRLAGPTPILLTGTIVADKRPTISLQNLNPIAPCVEVITGPIEAGQAAPGDLTSATRWLDPPQCIETLGSFQQDLPFRARDRRDGGQVSTCQIPIRLTGGMTVTRRRRHDHISTFPSGLDNRLDGRETSYSINE